MTTHHFLSNACPCVSRTSDPAPFLLLDSSRFLRVIYHCVEGRLPFFMRASSTPWSPQDWKERKQSLGNKQLIKFIPPVHHERTSQRGLRFPTQPSNLAVPPSFPIRFRGPL